MASMANLHRALGKLEKEGSLDRTIDKVQEAIDLLTKAKAELTSRMDVPDLHTIVNLTLTSDNEQSRSASQTQASKECD